MWVELGGSSVAGVERRSRHFPRHPTPVEQVGALGQQLVSLEPFVGCEWRLGLIFWGWEFAWTSGWPLLPVPVDGR